MRSMLLDIAIALLIMILGQSLLVQAAGLADGEEVPLWITLAPMALAVGFLWLRTAQRNRKRREEEAQQQQDLQDFPPPAPGPDDPYASDDYAPTAPMASGHRMTDYEWRSALESRIRSLDQASFEQFTRHILSALDIERIQQERIAFDGAVEVTGRFAADSDEGSGTVYAVSRRSFGSLGANQIRDLRQLMEGNADGGLFLTNGEFSASAMKEAAEGPSGVPDIRLIDGNELLDLMHVEELGLIIDEFDEVRGIDEEWFQALRGELQQGEPQ